MKRIDALESLVAEVEVRGSAGLIEADPVYGAGCFSVAEAAQFAGLSTSEVRLLVRDGRIPHTRCGTRVLVPKLGLIRFLRDQEPQGG